MYVHPFSIQCYLVSCYTHVGGNLERIGYHYVKIKSTAYNIAIQCGSMLGPPRATMTSRLLDNFHDAIESIYVQKNSVRLQHPYKY